MTDAAYISRSVSRWLAFCAAGLLLLLPAVVLAQGYALAVNDRVRVNVYGWPDLSGDYGVSVDGILAMPLAGEIRALGVTPADLSGKIADRLALLLPARPNVVLEVVGHGPIYVIGSVANPGAYEFMPGMTVLMAVARASGSPVVGGGEDVEAIRTRERLETLELRRERLRVQAARLRAERDGRETIDLDGITPTPRLEALIAEEEALMALRRETAEAVVAQLRRQQERFGDEAGSLERQLAAKDQEIGFLTEQIEGLQALPVQGVSRRTELIDYQRQLVAAEGDRHGVAAFRSRALQNVNRTETEITEREAARQTGIATEIRQTGEEAAELDLQIASTRRVLFALGAPVSMDPVGNRAYRIHRRAEEGIGIVEGAEDMMLRPGDVVEILDGPSGG